jgi:acyl carrier protein
VNTREQVLEVLVGLGFPPAGLTDGERLADLGIDSTEMVEIVVALERRFGFRLPAGAEEDLVTIGDLVAGVEQHAPQLTTGA